jgi:AcrR family transcriptional regulator
MNKERTRRRLLQAILKTIHRHGYGALTTGRVAQLAGVAQPTFYVHFRSMDQALEQVADWVAEELGPSFDRRGAVEADRAADVLQEAVAQCTRALVRDRKVAEVFLRSQIRPDIAPGDAALHADLLVGAVFALAEADLDGRVEDIGRATSIASRGLISSILTNAPVADAA